MSSSRPWICLTLSLLLGLGSVRIASGAGPTPLSAEEIRHLSERSDQSDAPGDVTTGAESLGFPITFIVVGLIVLVVLLVFGDQEKGEPRVPDADADLDLVERDPGSV